MASAPSAPSWESLPPAIREQLQISKEQFEAIHEAMREREKKAPPVGSEAPDFELKRLDADGVLTDRTLRLSGLRGRPVALVFGSYT
jgi:hypothetical protein